MIFEQQYWYSEHFYAVEKGHRLGKDKRVGEFQLRWQIGGDTVEIWGFEVYKPFRRRGHADRMMREVLRRAEWFKGSPCKFLRLYVKRGNHKAVKLYKSWGFVVAAYNAVSGDYTMSRFI